MKLYLDTSAPTTIIKLDGQEYRWGSGRNLAEQLHQYLGERLKEHGKTWADLTEITFMSGPGSFTGLRIGAAVVNSLAHELHIPLYNHKGEQVPVIIPDYGRPANVTPPRK